MCACIDILQSDADDVPVCPVCREKIDVSLEVDIDANRDDPAEEEQVTVVSSHQLTVSAAPASQDNRIECRSQTVADPDATTL